MRLERGERVVRVNDGIPPCKLSCVHSVNMQSERDRSLYRVSPAETMRRVDVHTGRPCKDQHCFGGALGTWAIRFNFCLFAISCVAGRLNEFIASLQGLDSRTTASQ